MVNGRQGGHTYVMISTLLQGLKFRKLRFSFFQDVPPAGDIAQNSAILWPLFTEIQVSGTLAIWVNPSPSYTSLSFYTPPHKKWRGIMLYPPKILSVRPSVSASFPDSNLSSFRPVFFKLCMDIDIGGEWFGSANGLYSFINKRVMALDWCNKCSVRTLTCVVYYRFSSNFAWTLILGRSGLGLQKGQVRL